MKVRILDFLKRYLIVLCWVYFTILFGWLVIYLLTGDQFVFMGFLTNIAVYLFIPVPIVALTAVFTRRKDLMAGTVLGLAVFLWFWGALFVPRLNVPQSDNPSQTLTVMTYNVLGLHDFAEPIIDVIREVDADIVCLQEVNPRLAAALQDALIDVYPFQIADPQEDYDGMATISKYPLQLTGEQFPSRWMGVPQIMALDFQGQPITLVNFHTHPYTFRSGEAFRYFNNRRHAQAQILANFAEEIETPLILAGDANDTSLSETYKIITHSPLKDAWREAGFGLGNTFPGSDIPGSSRRVGPLILPQWMTRIDHIFVSPHWEIISANVAPFDGISDHRGVVAELVLGE